MSGSLCSVAMNMSGGDCCSCFSEPELTYDSMTPFIETVYVQPGINMYIVRIPAEGGLDISFDVKGGLMTFECWLSGNLEYHYTGTDGKKGTDRVRQGYVISGKAEEEKGFLHKPDKMAVEMIKLSFDPAVFQMVLQRIFGLSDIPEMLSVADSGKRFLSVPMTASVEAAARSIADCPHVNQLRNPVLSNLANGLFYTIITDMLTHRTGTGSFNMQPEDIEKFYKIKSMIDENLCDPLSHSQIARRAGINEFKLKNGFKEIFGTTVNTYLTEQRVINARKMLESGRVSVSEAAWNVGYTNVSHFISVFRKHYGVTPGKFLMDIKHRLGRCCLRPSV
ncbi:MAG: helix-turn-helix transcriptional regulator [Deferribacterales bacterium]